MVLEGRKGKSVKRDNFLCFLYLHCDEADLHLLIGHIYDSFTYLHFEGVDLFLVRSLDIEVWFVLKFERPWCGIAVLWASGCIVRTEELWVGSHEWGRIFVSPALGAGKKKEEGHGVLLSLD